MKKGERGRLWQLFLPWAALALATFAWFGSQQIGTTLTVVACRASGMVPILLIGLVALALAIAGGVLSRRAWQDSAADTGRSFTALIGMLSAALLGLAIFYQTAAALIIPSCFG